eukprot:jgi/Ulvmu1/1431/UM011_0160.1
MRGSKKRTGRQNARKKTKADFLKCEDHSLQKYAEKNQLDICKESGVTKAALADAISQHFSNAQAPVDECKVISAFLSTLKNKSGVKPDGSPVPDKAVGPVHGPMDAQQAPNA